MSTPALIQIVMVSETLSAFIVQCNLFIMESYKEEYLNGKLKCFSEPNVYLQSFIICTCGY